MLTFSSILVLIALLTPLYSDDMQVSPAAMVASLHHPVELTRTSIRITRSSTNDIDMVPINPWGDTSAPLC